VLLREGLGRPAQAEDASQPKLPQTIRDVRALSHADLEKLVAIHFIDEVRTLLAGDGERLLRERLDRLCGERREALREALAG
jgi:hypothetical protein